MENTRPALDTQEMSKQVSAHGRRAGGREGRRVMRSKAVPSFPTLVRNIPVYQMVPDEAIELIHDESLKILEEIGCEFRDADAHGPVVYAKSPARDTSAYTGCHVSISSGGSGFVASQFAATDARGRNSVPFGNVLRTNAVCTVESIASFANAFSVATTLAMFFSRAASCFFCADTAGAHARDDVAYNNNAINATFFIQSILP